jgi:hypothetical protein
MKVHLNTPYQKWDKGRQGAAYLVRCSVTRSLGGTNMGGGQIGVSEGEQQLRTYCLEAAEKLGLEMDRAYWADDYINEKRILTVIAKTGETEIWFSQQEIDDYTHGISTGGADKIREALEDILD